MPGTRLCVRCGIVDMNGESAQGFVLDVRSCSNVGSMKLWGCMTSIRPVVKGN